MKLSSHEVFVHTSCFDVESSTSFLKNNMLVISSTKIIETIDVFHTASPSKSFAQFSIEL